MSPLDLLYTVVVPMAAYSVAGTMTPGPNNVMLATSGANFGFRRTIGHMGGVILGAVFLLFAVSVGLGAVFAAAPALQLGIKIAGALFLLYLAWRVATAAPKEETNRRGRPLSFLEAFGFQFANPKAWTVAGAAASTFLPAEVPAVFGATVLATTFAVVAVPAFVTSTVFSVGIGHARRCRAARRRESPRRGC